MKNDEKLDFADEMANYRDSFISYNKIADKSINTINTYKNCLEISGRIPNAAVDTTFVYLSNLKEITFEQAWNASGLSSNMNDYFSLEDAVLVDVRDE